MSFIAIVSLLQTRGHWKLRFSWKIKTKWWIFLCSLKLRKSAAYFSCEVKLEYLAKIIPHYTEDAFTFKYCIFSSQQKRRKECSCCIIGSRYSILLSQYSQSKIGYGQNVVQYKVQISTLKFHIDHTVGKKLHIWKIAAAFGKSQIF